MAKEKENEDLTGQVEAAASLAKAMKDVLNISNRIQFSFSNQLTAIKEVCEALGCVKDSLDNDSLKEMSDILKSIASNAEGLNDINDVLKDVSKHAKKSSNSMNDMKKAIDKTNSSLEKMNETLTEISKDENSEKLNAMNESLEDISSSADTAASALDSMQSSVDNVNPGNINNVSSALSDLSRNTGKSDSVISRLGKGLSGGIGTAGKIASGVLQGVTNGLKLLWKAGGMVVSIVGSLVKGLFKIGRALINVPITIIKTLFDMADSGSAGISELAQALNDLKEEFGALSGPTNTAIVGMAHSMQNLSKSGVNVFRTFGTVAERIKVLGELFKTAGPNFRSFSEEMMKNDGSIAVFAKGLGLGGEQLEKLALRSKVVGKEITDTMIDITKYSTHMAKAFKLDAKIISREMGKAAQDMKHFGNISEKQIGIAVTYAQKLGIQLDSITGSFDKFATFDDAAENISKLNEAFNANIDIGEVVMEQDPTKQMEIIRKGLIKAGVEGEKLTFAQRRLIQGSTSWDDATSIAALSTKNQNVELGKLEKEADKAEKKIVSQTDAIKELTGAIKENLKAMNPPAGKGFFGRFLEGMKMAFKMNPSFIKLMNNIRSMFFGAFASGKKFGDMLIKKIPFITTLMDALADVFDPAKFNKLLGGVTGAFGNFFDNLKKDPVKAFSTLTDDLMKVFGNFANSESPAMKKIFEGFKQAGNFIVKVLEGLLPAIMNKAADIIDALTSFIANPKEYIDKAKGKAQAAIAAGKGYASALSPIGQAVMAAWPRLEESLKKLFELLSQKFKEFAEEKGPVLKEYVQKYVVGALVDALLSPMGIAMGVMKVGNMIGSVVTMMKSANLAAEISNVSSALGGMGQATAGVNGALSATPGMATNAATSFSTMAKTAGAAAAAIAAIMLAADQAQKFFKENKDIIDKLATGSDSAENQKTQIENAANAARAAVDKTGQDRLTALSASLIEAEEKIGAVQARTGATLKRIGEGFEEGLIAGVGATVMSFNPIGMVMDSMAATENKLNQVGRHVDKRREVLNAAIEKDSSALADAQTLQRQHVAKLNEGLSAGQMAAQLALESHFNKTGKLLDFNVAELQAGVEIDGQKFSITDAKELEAFLEKRQQLVLEKIAPKGVHEAAQQRLTEESAKAAAEAAKKAQEEGERLFKETQDAMGVTTVDNVEERLQKIKEVGEKIYGSQTEFEASMKKLRDTLAKMDFTIMSPDVMAKFKEAVGSMQMVTTFVGSIKSAIVGLEDVSTAGQSIGDPEQNSSVGGQLVIVIDRFKGTLSKFKSAVTGKDGISEIIKGEMLTAIDTANTSLSEFTPKLKTFDGHFSLIKTAFTTGQELLESVASAVPTYAEKLQLTSQSIAALGKDVFPKFAEDVSTSVTQAAIDPVVTTFSQVIDLVSQVEAKAKELEQKLLSGHEINIDTAMKNFLKHDGHTLGVAGGAYSVRSKDVVINVAFRVAIDASEMEGHIIQGGKQLKQKINFILDALPDTDFAKQKAEQADAYKIY